MITKLSDFAIDSNEFTLSTVNTDRIICIVGKDEIKHVFPNQKSGSVLISITEPDSDFIDPEVVDRYEDSLQIQFWDVTDESTALLKSECRDNVVEPLTPEQGKIIHDFILKHRDKQFAIHCHAGISRSAGVGKAINCILDCNNDLFEYSTCYEDTIKSHWRYRPNSTVFERIIRAGEHDV